MFEISTPPQAKHSKPRAELHREGEARSPEDRWIGRLKLRPLGPPRRCAVRVQSAQTDLRIEQSIFGRTCEQPKYRESAKSALVRAICDHARTRRASPAALFSKIRPNLSGHKIGGGSISK